MTNWLIKTIYGWTCNGGKVYGAKFFDKSYGLHHWVINNILVMDLILFLKIPIFQIYQKDVGFLIDEEKLLGNPEQNLTELKDSKYVNNLPEEIKDFMNAKSFTYLLERSYRS